MRCPNRECTGVLAPNKKDCPACGCDGGAPNVRLAKETKEVVELELRLAKTKANAEAGGYSMDLDRLANLAERSEAVICMPSVRLQQLLSDDSLLSTFGLQVDAQSRVPLDNRYDRLRSSVEGAVFPNFDKQIRFAALTISDVGQAAYGACSVVLKESAIASRSSVFEFPLFDFAKRGQLLGQDIPVGHRATWENRGKLVCAKLGDHCQNLTDEQMADLILPTPTDTQSDCVEVHIFESINLHSISHVTITQPTQRADEVLQEFLLEQLIEKKIPARRKP